jgi:hypothetical protein
MDEERFMYRGIKPLMKLNAQDLEKVSRRTREHYDRDAEDFWRGTRGHDVRLNVPLRG